MTNRTHRLGLLGITGVSLLVAAGCSSDLEQGSGAEANPAPPIEGRASYEVRTDVTRLTAAEWDALVVANDGPGLWLKPEARDRAFLQPGAVTVIQGRGVLKVGRLIPDGDHLTVEKAPFGFGDWMENGTVDISGAVPFDKPFVDSASELAVIDNGPFEEPSPPAPAEAIAPSSARTSSGTTPQSVRPRAQNALGPDQPPSKASTTSTTPLSTLTTLLTDGWKVTKDVKGNGDHLDYDIVMTKDSGGFVARLQAKGTLTNLETLFKTTVVSRSTTHESLSVKATGEADLSWEIGIRDGSASYNKVVLPGLTYKLPFFLGEVPMLLRVQTGFVPIIAASGKNSTTTGTVHVKWSNDGGIKVTPGAGAGTGSGTGDAEFHEDRGSLAVSVSGFGVVATLPRVDVGVGIDKLFVAGGYFKNTATAIVKSRGALGGNPCADVETTFVGTVGMVLEAGGNANRALEALGINVDDVTKKVYDVKKTGLTCGLK